MAQFAPIFIFIPLALGFALFNLTLFRVLGARSPNIGDKLTSYECGEEPQGNAWVKYNLRFYSVALVFLIFDVDIVATIPIALIYKELLQESNAMGWIVFSELFLFLGILFVGLIYVIRKGDLEWIKTTKKQKSEVRSHI